MGGVTPAIRRNALTKAARAHAANLPRAEAYLLSRGISLQAAELFQLGVVESGEFAGRLSIPYITPAGVVAMKYRCIEHDDCKPYDHAKYLNESGQGLNLYNAQVLINCADTVVVTEGELDAICVQAYCGTPAVAYPGVSNWSKQKHYPLCFEGLSEVIVVADGDKVGKEAAEKVAKDVGIRARVVDMPSGQDSNSFITTQGAGAFIERIMR